MPGPEFSAALACHRAGDLEAAERLYREVLRTDEDGPSLHNLATILKRSDRFDEAEDFFVRATRVARDPAAAFFSLGAYYRLGRRLDLSEAALRRALALRPENGEYAFELGLTLLAMGRFTEGWWHYERRGHRERMMAQKLRFPEWRGEPLTGKRLLVWREQGYGDQIMMARFLSQLDAAEITYAGLEGLSRLFARLPVTFLDAPYGGGKLEVPPHDYWVLPMSLPTILGAQLESLPNAPYLSGTAKNVAGRVGLIWEGEAKNPNARYRTLPAGAVQRLLALPGVISLNPADTGARDFQDTADIIAGLDLVVSIDTSVAHLAGAMGRPVWVLLGALGLDWQWLTGRADSPWYPSARIIRQSRAGDWDSVVDEVERDLRVLGLAG